ncbi:MAG: hypothetical protein D6689_07410 [Deltaproteobacteria bacterium]|nr:MAG: hypothetical protein D6689_07410 [Deltaproteobacteria bacterium]
MAPDGSLWIAGDFQAEVVVGGKTLASRGNSDVLLAHVTADGAAIGAYSFGSYFHDFAVGVAVDAAGGPVVIGSFEQSIDFGGGELKGVKKKDMFLARFDANGAHLWSKAFGGRDDDVGGGVAVDAHGDVIATGWFWHGVDFGTGRLDSAGDSDIVVAKYAPNGEPIWARRFGDAGADFGRAVAVGPDGAAAVAGTFRGTVDFGGGPLTFAGERKGAKGDAFVAVFGP